MFYNYNLYDLFGIGTFRDRGIKDFNEVWKIDTYLPNDEIKKENEETLIRIQMPGFSKEEVSVKVEGNILVVSAVPDKDNKLVKSKILREYKLLETADKDSISAELKNGILLISIKKINNPVKNIDIKVL